MTPTPCFCISWLVTTFPHLCFSLICDRNCFCENSLSPRLSSFSICGDGNSFCGDSPSLRLSSFLICGDGNSFCGDCLPLPCLCSLSSLICGDGEDCRCRNHLCVCPSWSGPLPACDSALPPIVSSFDGCWTTCLPMCLPGISCWVCGLSACNVKVTCT